MMSIQNIEDIRKIVRIELQEIFKKDIVQERKKKKRNKKSKKMQYPSGRFYYPVFGGLGMYGGGAVDYGDSGGGDSGGGDSGGGDGGGGGE